MQTKAFDQLFREMVEQTTSSRIQSYINHCKKLTPKQKAILIMYLFDEETRNELMRQLYNSKRYAEAGMVCIYLDATATEKISAEIHD